MVAATENVESVEKPKKVAAETTAVADESDLSRNQVPVEQAATSAAVADLPPVLLTEAGKPALTDAAIKTTATELSGALTVGYIYGADFNAAKNLLSPMNESGTKRLEAMYPTLRKDLETAFGKDERFRELEALLDRKDGKTNIVGNIAQALEVAKVSGWDSGITERETAGRMLRAALGPLDSKQLTEVKADWDKRYGKEYGSFDQAIASGSLNPTDKALVKDFYSKGSDARTSADIQAAATSLLKDYNSTPLNRQQADRYLGQLSDVLGGPSQSAVEARKALKTNSEFAPEFDKAFGANARTSETQKRIAADFVSEGRISIGTIVTGNSKTLAGFFDNPDNISLALTHATPKERQDFIEGKRLSGKQDLTNLTEVQIGQMEFYKKLDDAFKANGNPRQQAIYADQLANGKKTQITEMAELHTEANMFGFGGGHSTQKMMASVENMTRENWELIRPTAKGAESPYMKDLKASIGTYTEAGSEEQKRLFALLDAKAGVKTYEDSQSVKRSFADVVKDNSDNTEDSRIALAKSVASMTPADAAAYKANPELRQQTQAALGEFAGADKDAAALLLSKSLLSQVEKTGQPPKLYALDTFAKDVVDGKLDDPGKRMAAVETLMKDSALLARAKAIQDNLDLGTMYGANPTPENVALTGLLRSGATESGYRALLRGEPIGIGVKISTGGGTLGEGFKGLYDDIAALPKDERDRIRGLISPDQQKVLDNVIAQGGKPNLADDFQSYLIGDGGSHKEFTAKVAAMSDAERTQFMADVQRKYGQDFNKALIASAVARDGVSAENKQVLEKLASQNWKPTLADEARQFVLDGGNYQDFAKKFGDLNFTQKEQLKSEYSSKYSTSLDKDFLAKVPHESAETFQDLLRSRASDPLQNYFDRVAGLDKSGFTPDGTLLNVERALQVNRDFITQYQANREKLPPNVQAALDQYYTEAVKQNGESKERLAEVAVQTAVIAAAIASIPVTGGLSTLTIGQASALIAASATGGAVMRPALMAAIEGKGMTMEKAMQQAKLGALDGM
ncbi:MAG: hypothetical protein IAF58_20380, partial [Leptolyngbya sp.]|nr:hypothetical protein [Candidatus Melainabacteria bacterium]